MSGLRLSLLAVFTTVGLLLLPLAARADEGDDAKKGDAPRIKVEVRKLEPKAGEAPAAPKDPAHTIHRWLTGEMQKVGKASDDAASPLHAWFEGGDDVPLAGLRDALKADGFTADQVMQWIQHHAAAAMQGMRMQGPQAGGMGPWSRTHRYQMPGHTMRGFRMGGPRGFGRRGGRFGGGSPWGNAWGGRAGPFGGPMPGWGGGGGRPGWGGMFGGPVQQQSRTIIMWNDGTGWQRREIPGGMPSTNPWSGFQQGFGQPPRPPAPPQAPGGQMPDWLRKMIEGGAGQAPNQPDAARMLEWLRRMQQGSEDAPPSPWLKSYGWDRNEGQPKVRVKSVQPKKLEIVEEEIEEEIEVTPKK